MSLIAPIILKVEKRPFNSKFEKIPPNCAKRYILSSKTSDVAKELFLHYNAYSNIATHKQTT